VHDRHPLWQQQTLAEVNPARARRLKQFDWRPLDWRGALIVTVLEGEPKAIAHIPSGSIWPFVMSLGFVGIFASALLEHLILFILGASISLIALIAWFLPQATERRALADAAHAAPGDLPLVIAGRDANGYWGTIVLLLVLGTALATLVTSYFYLLPDTGIPSRRMPATWQQPAMISLCFVGIASLLAWLCRAIRMNPRSPVQVWLIAVLLLPVVAIQLLVGAYIEFGVIPETSAYGSVIVALIGFQILLALLITALALAALLWAVAAPGDVRGHAIIHNLSLIGYFGAASALLVMAVIYV
jgi:hypothetical protein